MTSTRLLAITAALVVNLCSASAWSQAREQDLATHQLPAWEQLSQAQRDELIAPVRERWNASPEERAQMQERARRWLAMPPEQRNRAHRGMHRWERMDPATRAQMKRLFELTRDMPRDQRKTTFALFDAMRTMSANEREALRQQWSKMTAQQHEQWMREHWRPHRHGDRGGHRGPPSRDND